MKLALANTGTDGDVPTEAAASLPRSAGRLIHTHAISVGIALVLSAGFVLTGWEAPLPALGWAAVFLFLAVEQDVRGMRIPNLLTFPALGIALGLGFLNGGLGGLQTAVLGAGAAFAVLFVPYCIGWLGAGDAKAVMVLGALWGSELLFPVLWWMILMGGLFAVALLVVQGGMLDLLRRWWSSLKLSVLTRRPTYVAPAADSTAARGLPFAVAMALGATAFHLWGMPWN